MFEKKNLIFFRFSEKFFELFLSLIQDVHVSGRGKIFFFITSNLGLKNLNQFPQRMKIEFCSERLRDLFHNFALNCIHRFSFFGTQIHGFISPVYAFAKTKLGEVRTKVCVITLIYHVSQQVFLLSTLVFQIKISAKS